LLLLGTAVPIALGTVTIVKICTVTAGTIVMDPDTIITLIGEFLGAASFRSSFVLR
jgi:hypothetical protein